MVGILIILLVISLVLAVVNFFKLEDLRERETNAEERALEHFKNILAIDNQINCYKARKEPIYNFEGHRKSYLSKPQILIDN